LARVAPFAEALAFVPLALPFAPAGVVVEPVAVDSPLAPSAATSLIACRRRCSSLAAASRFCLADPMARAARLLGLTPPDFLAFFFGRRTYEQSPELRVLKRRRTSRRTVGRNADIAVSRDAA
jgi:hypothetical protein